MGLSLKPEHLRRYRDMAVLLLKYGPSDMVFNAGLGMDESDPEVSASANGSNDDLADDLEALGPTFVKVGQLLSTRADLLPPETLRALSRLQDDVAPFPFEDVDGIMTEELGVRISKAFSRFDPEPIAAASLGQVHRAALRDGREVAVKIQRPNIREQVLEDMETMGEVAEFLDKHSETGRRIGLKRMVDELKRSLLLELDYRLEAQNMILAAMIIGAAMLMRVETSFRIMGYPGLAMLFFLGAALGASWMAFGILRDDHHHTRRPT